MLTPKKKENDAAWSAQIAGLEHLSPRQRPKPKPEPTKENDKK